MVVARITGPIILALVTTMTFELIQKRRHFEIGAKWMDVVSMVSLAKCLVEGIDLPGNEEGFIEVCSTQSDHNILGRITIPWKLSLSDSPPFVTHEASFQHEHEHCITRGIEYEFSHTMRHTMG